MKRLITRLLLSLIVLTTVGCGFVLPDFPPQFVQPNHIAGGPSWTTGAASNENSEPDLVGRATGAYLQDRASSHQVTCTCRCRSNTCRQQRCYTDGATRQRRYSSLYFTPAIEVRGPTSWWIQGFASGGAGLARFETSDRLLSDGTNLAARSTYKLAPFINLGVDFHFSAHWSIRADGRGLYVEPEFVDHVSSGRASFSVLPVFRF